MSALGPGLGLSADGLAVEVGLSDHLGPEARVAVLVGHLDIRATPDPVGP